MPMNPMMPMAMRGMNRMNVGPPPPFQPGPMPPTMMPPSPSMQPQAGMGGIMEMLASMGGNPGASPPGTAPGLGDAANQTAGMGQMRK